MPIWTSPDYNLTYRWWRPHEAPQGNPPRGTGLCQLYYNSRADIDQRWGSFIEYMPPIYLRIPRAQLMAMRATMLNPAIGSIINCYLQWTDVSGITWTYIVRFWEWVHAGFPNEYAMITLGQATPTGGQFDPQR